MPANDVIRVPQSAVDDLFDGFSSLPLDWQSKPRNLSCLPLTDRKGLFVSFRPTGGMFHRLESNYDRLYLTDIWPEVKRERRYKAPQAWRSFDSRRYFGSWDVVSTVGLESLIGAVTVEKLCLWRPICDQGLMLEALYRMIFPDWDRIIALDGWPECNKATAVYITKRFMEFDREHHPDVLNGGAWMNSGWSQQGQDLPDWHVRTCPVRYRP